jgi:two-component system chemotaxis response regulator CheB
VLIVDDSAVVRKLLGDALRKEPDIEVVGGASDPFLARDMILQLEPDLLTLDIEMPRMDGLSFLRRLMEHHPVPAIVISSLTQAGSAASVEALRIGAIDVIAKPGGPTSVGLVTEALVRRIRAMRAGPPPRLLRSAPQAAAAVAKPALSASRLNNSAQSRSLIAIGASTGGTQAIEAVLSRLPAQLPPVVVVQHMPAGFTRSFAGRLDQVCAQRVVEAADGQQLEPGTVYIAPGDYHMAIEQDGLRLRTRLSQGPMIHYQRPAVDVLFHSVARLRGRATVGVLLTGMGADGADGMVALRAAGATTIAEAEESCIVFGMPKEAIARGGATHVESLLRMPGAILNNLAALLESKSSGSALAARG